MNDARAFVGLVDGSVVATTQRFRIVLDPSSVLQLDDLVVTEQTLPDSRVLRHFGIVVEGNGQIEGAKFASDTHRIAGSCTMPGELVRSVEVQVLRTEPELWIAPLPGARVFRARGDERRLALFCDRMTGNELYLGLDRDLEPVSIDWSFFNGEKGAHLSISGISGVATKTSYALFTLYMLMETPQGRALLGRHVAHTKAVVFNVKGEDLLHIDRPNARFPGDERSRGMWRALGVENPQPFQNVGLFVPPTRLGDIPTAALSSRRERDYTLFGWSPLEFVRRGLLSFVFSDARERTQVSFVVDHVRAMLARHAVPSLRTPGAIVMRENPQGAPRDFERASEALAQRAPEFADGDPEITTFAELVEFISDRVEQGAGWVPGTTQGTDQAFLRRLAAMNRRLGQLVSVHVRPLILERNVSVIDLHALHEDAQRFVVGAVLDQVWSEKQGSGREPLRFIVLDELNKYAPRDGNSPIKEILVDIAARGRSLGVILIGCQQNATGVDGAITDNAAIKIVGRLDAAHADEYRFLSTELRQRATRFVPGTMVLDQPVVPAPIPIIFPFPPYATNVAEDREGAVGGNGQSDPLDMLVPF